MKNCNKEYDLAKNEKIKAWLELKEKRGYIPDITTEELQDLIDKIVLWYEWKYPDFMLDDSYLACNNPYNPDIKEQVEALSAQMTLEQLLNRLTYNQYYFLENVVQNRCEARIKVYKYDCLGDKEEIRIYYNEGNLEVLDPEYSLEQIVGDKIYAGYSWNDWLKEKTGKDYFNKITLSDLQKLINMYRSNAFFDTKKLDMLLFCSRSAADYRKKILDLAALKLAADSRNKYVAWKRSQLFIEDIEKNLHISIGEGIEKARTLKRTKFDNN